jgi:Na+-driven multidrug efflux pump
LAPARVAGGISTIRLAGLAWPISGQVLIEALRWLGFFLIVERMGRDALAASSIVFACYTLLLVPTDACAQAIYSLVSSMIGRGQASQIRALIRRITGGAYGITAPFLVFLAVAPATALSIFTGEHSTLHGAVGPLRLLPLLVLVTIPSDAWLAAVFGTGDTRFGAAVEVVASVVVLVGAYTIGLALHADLIYVWATLGAAAVVTWSLARARLRGGHWRTLEI